ncbi:FMN-dependent oxidoreductase (nitrilotriacetate monooxygenase family) [Arthrobacter woluwensis]|uniref:LLM class flavin-dependent oxidoreductase n=1 Tax=Arthrobacter woluwensis TaxID=156980 RepID=UPI00277F68CB|nr:LLM class flavin-dependent oxidoreductase [Arthrobacter woluwensis]MDQ0707768.1 FMN-dependent oxidoreductase (nitrilotriacetate monooxygenase family) [Arthrobacter woluwensis]
MPRQLILNAFLMSNGHHEASWRLPESDTRAATDVKHYQRLAQTAEKAHFDAVFFADSPLLHGDVTQRPYGVIEPTVLLAAIAAVTERIGLVATASTSYNEPYNLARRFAGLEQISGGRSGWNVVTTAGDAAARNFSLDSQPAHADRYARAEEFLQVTEKLWDSWEDEVHVGDKDRGVWGDPSRVHPVLHRGEFFQVEGALDAPRSPQGRPVIIQAGSSESGRDFAARWAEAIFTAHQTVESAREFYADLKRRVALAGRDADAVKILPGIVPVIGATEEEARALDEELNRLILPEHALRHLAGVIGVDPSRLALDEQLPDDLPEESQIEANKSRRTLIVELGRSEGLTVRQIIGRLGGGRGHQTFAGTAEQVADRIEHWFTTGAADGFNIMPPVLPSGLDVFTRDVVPILQERGLFRTEYTGTTLREHYGLPRPANLFAARHDSAEHDDAASPGSPGGGAAGEQPVLLGGGAARAARQ